MTINLRNERRRRGWSLTRVGGLTGIAASDLSLLERGLRQAFPSWRERLCDAFGLPENILFSPAQADHEQPTTRGAR